MSDPNPYGVPVWQVLPAAPPPSGPRNWRVPVAVAVVVALLAAGGWAVLRPHGSHSAASQPSRPLAAAAAGQLHAPDHVAGGYVVNDALATTLVTRYWATHEPALVAKDLPTLAAMSTGAAQRWEQASVACGCLAVDAARPIDREAVLVPRERHYPAFFVGQVQTSYRGVPWTEVLVFTKARPGATWLVTEDSGFGPGAGGSAGVLRPNAGGSGFDRPVTAAQHRIAHGVVNRLAAVWRSTNRTGRVPTGTGFDLTGSQNEARLSLLAAERQGQVGPTGLIGRFSFKSSRQDRLYEVGLSGGWDLACQPLREVVDYTAPPGESAYQPPDQSNWGPGLPPGHYTAIVDRDVWQTCFAIPPHPRSSDILVLDQDASGKVARPAPGLTT